MPPGVASGNEAPAALPAVDESAAQHGALEKQVAPPAALSPAQPHTSEGRQHPRRSIDVEPAQVCSLRNVPVCDQSVQQTPQLLDYCLML